MYEDYFEDKDLQTKLFSMTKYLRYNHHLRLYLYHFYC